MPSSSTRPGRPGLLARYDTQALRPPAIAPGGSAAAAVRAAAAHAAWHPLLNWCFDGAGTGACPLLAPRAAPDIGKPFEVALLGGPDLPTLAEFATALCLHLDGSVALAERPGRASRLAYRLQVKIQDACWWRRRHRADPWDCGWAGGDAAAAASLAHFAPRRATLIVVRDLLPDGACGEKTAALARSIAQLAADRAQWRHPVRLLLLHERESGLSGRALAARWMRDLSALGPVAVFEGPSPQLITRPPSMLSD